MLIDRELSKKIRRSPPAVIDLACDPWWTRPVKAGQSWRARYGDQVCSPSPPIHRVGPCGARAHHRFAPAPPVTLVWLVSSGWWTARLSISWSSTAEMPSTGPGAVARLGLASLGRRGSFLARLAHVSAKLGRVKGRWCFGAFSPSARVPYFAGSHSRRPRVCTHFTPCDAPLLS